MKGWSQTLKDKTLNSSNIPNKKDMLNLPPNSGNPIDYKNLPRLTKCINFSQPNSQTLVHRDRQVLNPAISQIDTLNQCKTLTDFDDPRKELLKIIINIISKP